MADYGDEEIKLFSARDAVLLRPTMYFGDHPPPEWPLILAAWTAVNLLEHANPDAERVELTLHSTGALTAIVRGACVTTHATSRLSAQELIRRKMWWADLGRSITVNVRHAESERAVPGRQADDAMVWEDVDIEVIFEADPDVIGVPPSQWWHDGPARLRQIFASMPYANLDPWQRVTVVEEATGSVITV